GDSCGDCGEVACQGDSALRCTTPSPAPKICLDSNTPRDCVEGYWETQPDCGSSYALCYQGNCVECIPGNFRCTDFSNDEIIQECTTAGSWSSIASCYASSSEVCNAATGTCTGSLYLPRDADFEIAPLLIGHPLERGRRTQDVLDAALGSAFG